MLMELRTSLQLKVLLEGFNYTLYVIKSINLSLKMGYGVSLGPPKSASRLTILQLLITYFVVITIKYLVTLQKRVKYCSQEEG